MADLKTSAVVVTTHGGTDVLEVQTRSVSAPGPGEVQIRVAASGINFVDVYERQGVYPVPTPFVLGKEGAGEVIAIGTDVADRFELGDVVAWAEVRGSHSAIVNADADRLVPVPEGVPVELAAAAMLQGMTAQYLVTSTYAVQPGDSVLVHAAAGGIGQLVVQLATARGATVIGTVSTPAKEAVALAAGAREVIRYTELNGPDGPDDLAAEVRRRNGDRGVNVVYDSVGRTTFDASLASLARRGTLVLCGGSSGQVPPFDAQRLNHGGSLFLTRPKLADYTATRDELLWRAAEVLHAVGDGALRIDVSERHPLGDVRVAYDALESRRTTGKLLLVP
ncbi:MAG TPA: quinone oxidoreductase [Jatrophihabitantaceae bacterium]|nr:quinone oxidoreductase [Jatrophihabitantaceae bacterium]